MPASYNFGYLILDFYLFIVWTILAYTMPWGMFDAFSVGGILAIRTKEKKPLLKTGHIAAIVAVLLFIICVVSMMRANNVGG